MSIYVGNIAYNVSQEDIQEVFAEYATDNRDTVPKDRETGRPRG